MPVVDVSNLKVADLKRELKERGLPLTGNKTELQERLQAAMDGGDASITGEDILDEEDTVLSDDEKMLVVDENELLHSPSATPTLHLSKSSGESSDAVLHGDDILESPTAVAKRVVLKRKLSSEPTEAVNTTAKENIKPTAGVIEVSSHVPVTSTGASTVNFKNLKGLTMKERLDMRAKRFGTSETSASKGTEATSIATASDVQQVEVLKKRAERFGVVTSTNLAKLDAEEKLLKRKQRFSGDVKATSSEPASDTGAFKIRRQIEYLKKGSDPVAKNMAVEDGASTNSVGDTAESSH